MILVLGGILDLSLLIFGFPSWPRRRLPLQVAVVAAVSAAWVTTCSVWSSADAAAAAAAQVEEERRARDPQMVQ